MTTDTPVDDARAEPVRLPDSATVDDIEPDTPYVATINGIVEYGVFVDLNDSISGLVHESNLSGTYAVGDRMVVELDRVRDNGDISFVPREDLAAPAPPPTTRTAVTASTLADHVDAEVELRGTVTQIKQTTGPTLFHVTTGDGITTVAAFEGAGVRAHPEIELDDVVRVVGTVQRYDGDLQLEADDVAALEGDDRQAAEDAVAEQLEAAATPATVEPLVEWDALETLWPELEDVATRIREAILRGRPIRVRHHADVDGICASVPLQIAVERFVETVHGDPDAPRYLARRLPSKAPFYEMADATRDLNRALEERDRHGQRLPLVLMLDNGSTAEDLPAIETLTNYGLSVITIDHHFPDPEVVDDHLDAHVNPYLVGEDYRVTTAMLAVEVARMVAPSITEEIDQLPALAGTADRSEASAMDDYLALAGGDAAWVAAMTDAVDYAAHWLRFRDGRHLMHDLLDVECDDPERHRRVVELFAERAAIEVETQLEAAEPHLEHRELPNGADLYTVDLDRYAHRHIYPAPGKTTTAIHDERVAAGEGAPTITIGYGDDFAVLRSDGVRLDIPDIVDDLTESIRGGGVSGGGHLVVGSIRFLGGRREEVLDSLVERLGEAPTEPATEARRP
ncbi:MAG: DHH family phosphoesterase [Halobacteriales archaeon]